MALALQNLAVMVFTGTVIILALGVDFNPVWRIIRIPEPNDVDYLLLLSLVNSIITEC